MPGLITAVEMAQMQADANASNDLSIEIQRKPAVLTQGPTGNVLTAYTHLSTVNGSLAQPTAGQLQNYSYKIGSLTAWQVRLPAGTDVQATDRLIVGGETLEVQVVLTPQSYSSSTRLLATEIK